MHEFKYLVCLALFQFSFAEYGSEIFLFVRTECQTNLTINVILQTYSQLR